MSARRCRSIHLSIACRRVVVGGRSEPIGDRRGVSEQTEAGDHTRRHASAAALVRSKPPPARSYAAAVLFRSVWRRSSSEACGDGRVTRRARRATTVRPARVRDRGRADRPTSVEHRLCESVRVRGRREVVVVCYHRLAIRAESIAHRGPRPAADSVTAANRPSASNVRFRSKIASASAGHVSNARTTRIPSSVARHASQPGADLVERGETFTCPDGQSVGSSVALGWNSLRRGR